MDHAALTLLYAYNCWANDQILAAFQQLVATSAALSPATVNRYDGLIDTLCHIANTEMAWHSLCTTGHYPAALLEAESVAVDELMTHWQAEMQRMMWYIRALTDDDLVRDLHFMVGSTPRTRVLWQGFFHIINHGAQHRSEAAMNLTQQGHSPGDLDFTRFLATKGNEPKG